MICGHHAAEITTRSSKQSAKLKEEPYILKGGTKMKKKLSFVLALVFVLTLAFSILPGPDADAVEPISGTFTYLGKNESDPGPVDGIPGIYDLDGANIVIFKKSKKAEAVIWVDSTLPISEAQEPELYAILSTSAYDPSIAGMAYDVVRSNHIDFNDDIDIDMRTPTDTQFTISGTDQLSHYTLVKYNPPVEVGSLTVTKQVSGDSDYETSQVFRITVEFTPPDITTSLAGITTDPTVTTGTPVDTTTTPVVTLSGNVYTLYLRDGDSVDFDGIPAGTSYEIEEPDLPGGGWSNGNTSTELTGTIQKDVQSSVTVANTFVQQYGSLYVKKAVTNIEGEPALYTEIFDIEVIITKGPSGSFDDIVITADDALLITSTSTSTDGNTRTYMLALHHGQDVLFDNVPAGFICTVEEQLSTEQLAAVWTGSGSIEDQLITEGQQIAVTISNTYTYEENPVGALTVSKHVYGDGLTEYEENEVFDIIVTFTPPTDMNLDDMVVTPSTGAAAPDVDATGNIYTLHLKHNESVTFTDIPVGTTYTVEEPNVPTDWVAPGIDDISIVDDDNNSNVHIITANFRDEATVNNEYDPEEDPVGALTVSKNVYGDGLTEYEENEVFDIVVTFTPTQAGLGGMIINADHVTASPKYSITGYAYTLHLKHGEYVGFSNIPAETSYTVEETGLVTGWADPVIDIDDHDDTSDAHIITADNEDTAVVNNDYNRQIPKTATLKVDKSVQSGSKDQKFTITVVFKGEDLGYYNNDYVFVSYITNDKGLKGIPGTSDSGSESTSTPYYNTLTFTFKWSDNDGIVTFSNIPFGTRYTVNETLSYPDMPANWSNVSGNTGSAEADEIGLHGENPSDSVTIANRYDITPPPPSYGTLTVAKLVTGANASATEKFEFTVKFTPNASGIVAPAGATGGGNGNYKISLSASDGAVTFSNIPEGTAYTVTEDIKGNQMNAGWIQDTESGTEGTITAAGAAATITNTIGGVAGTSDEPEKGVAGDSDILPQTGGIAASTLLGIFGLALIAIGGTAFTIFKKKNTGRNNSK
jgi:LPXTG-motif cell wall-anchored protein